MSRHADFVEANLRIKRWAKWAVGEGIVKGGADPYVTYSELQPLSTRWQAWERMKWTLDGTKDGPVVNTECCVVAAQAPGELMTKYSLWAQDANRQGYFEDAHLRGQSTSIPPPEPPEWAANRAKMVDNAHQAGERTAEWVKRAARGQMAHIGLNDPVKFELAWAEARARGLVKG